MYRVRRVGRGRFGISSAGAVAASLVLCVSWQSSTSAQSASPRGNSPPATVGGPPDAQRGGVKPPSSRTDGPQQLLVQAETDLQEGRAAQGYQLLEDIIARHPGTRQAERAKDLLVEQFRSLRRAGDEVAADKPAVPSQPVGPGGRGDPVSTGRGPARVLRGTGDFKMAIGDRVFFDAGSTWLDPRQEALLRAQGNWLSEHADARVRIEARADDPGNNQRNDDLARDRADLVRALLVEAGVGKDRISVVALGNGQPIAKCAASGQATGTSPCAAQNRVVVTVVEWAPELLPQRRLVTGSVGTDAARGRAYGASPPGVAGSAR